MRYLDTSTVTSVRTTEPPRYGRDVSGYGCKIPTQYMLRTAGSARWRRVYCVCYSNSGTLYVCIGGDCLYIASWDDHVLTDGAS